MPFTGALVFSWLSLDLNNTELTLCDCVATAGFTGNL